MTLERRLREHFDRASAGLEEPQTRLHEVMRRGRRRRVATQLAVAAGVVAVAMTVPTVARVVEQNRVELRPAADAPSEPTPSEGLNTEPIPTEPPAESPPADPPGAVPIADLGAPVVLYGPYQHDTLTYHDGDAERVLVPGPVDFALPDGRGGLLYQPAGLPEIHWLPDVSPDGEAAVTLVSIETVAPDDDRREHQLLLRGVMPDGRAMFSMRPVERPREGDMEHLYAVELARGSSPELLGSSLAYESSTVGPATAARGQVRAACHIHCSLWAGAFQEPGSFDENERPLYQGLSIDGLTANDGGTVVAFVEYDPVAPEPSPPDLVLLDGRSLQERARVRLPWPAETPVGAPRVSLSPDGRDVLVSLGHAGAATAPPTTPFLVRDALSRQPEVVPIDAAGAVVWMHPAR